MYERSLICVMVAHQESVSYIKIMYVEEFFFFQYKFLCGCNLR